ncbi:hypothetical protein ES708_12338 [subsurface metagenome]
MTTALELQHFAVLTIAYFNLASSIFIVTTSNNPCHLTLYYTDKEPIRHATSRIVRGLSLPWGAYWCFVAWKEVEQQEAGDTLFHTFEVPAWSYCQTKWLCFRGTVASILSPSVSALLKHHHPGATPEQKFEFYDHPRPTYSNIYEPNQGGQTFTPTQVHLLTKVYTFIHRVTNTYPTLNLEIKEAPDDTPTGPVLSSGATPWAVIPEWPDPAWIETEMTPLVIKPTVKYTKIAHTSFVGQGILRWWYRSWDATYPRGIRIYSMDSGNTWSKLPLHDFLFQEWGIPSEGEP